MKFYVGFLIGFNIVVLLLGIININLVAILFSSITIFMAVKFLKEYQKWENIFFIFGYQVSFYYWQVCILTTKFAQ